MPSRANGVALSLSQHAPELSSQPTLLVGEVYLVHRPQHPSRPATILQTRVGKGGKEAYISYLGADKRLDAWVPRSQIGEKQEAAMNLEDGPSPESLAQASKPSVTVDARVVAGIPHPHLHPPPSAPSSPEREHATMTRVRNFEDVRFGEYLIKTWYYSPYPNPATHDDRLDDRAASPVPRIKQVQNNKRRKLGEGNLTRQNSLSLGMDGRDKFPSQEKEILGHATKDPMARGARHSRAESRPEGANGTIGTAGEVIRGRLWVCDLCFKYMRNRASWERHITSCDVMEPPGRRVYQKGSYTLWEIDGAQAPLYCQNLSLFGKLFIDHKSVFFYVENFLFYVLCDAATSRRDQVMAFFSKEKVSYDDYNLACIITFPPFQNRGFGKLLIEFSYYLTLHPSTRPLSLSPGTPERPLSDLGLKGYTAYWTSIILRFCRQALADAPPIGQPKIASPSKSQIQSQSQRARRSIVIIKKPKADTSVEVINDVEVTKTLSTSEAGMKGQYSISMTLGDLAKACHLRLDDVSETLAQLGFLRYRRRAGGKEGLGGEVAEQWADTEVVIAREDVEREWTKWKVRPTGVLDQACVLL